MIDPKNKTGQSGSATQDEKDLSPELQENQVTEADYDDEVEETKNEEDKDDKTGNSDKPVLEDADLEDDLNTDGENKYF